MRTETWAGLKTHIVDSSNGHSTAKGPVMILLHGFGAPGTDLVGLGSALKLPASWRCVFPEGPLDLGMDLGFGGARAWWWIDTARYQRALGNEAELQKLTEEVPEALPQVRQRLAAWLDETLRQLEADYSNLVLGGFSQGAMLACDVALRGQRSPAALVLLSSAIVARPQWLELLPKHAGTPVFLSHGREDQVLPFSVADQLHQAMVAAGLDVHWCPFDGGHGVSPPVLSELQRFLTTLQFKR